MSMKILIIHASAGAGHTKAAEALFQGIKKRLHAQFLEAPPGAQRTPLDFEVRLIDALDYTSPLYKAFYQKSYALMVTKCPAVWGFFFNLADLKILRGFVKVFRRCFNGLNTHRFLRYLKNGNFDYVISTHFFPNEVLAHLKREKIISSRIICVITDFGVHSIWVEEAIERYAVACEITQKMLRKLGVPGEKIVVTGIPTSEKFSQKRDKVALRRKLGLREDLFTVLVATGSFGLGPIEKIASALKDFQVIVVCGHNRKLFERLAQRRAPTLQVYGLVRNMDELMAVSDAMLTKAGGLSISEALINRLPLIFFNPIPGQETGNIRVLKEYGIGLSDCTIPQMVEALQALRSSTDSLCLAQEKTQILAKPQAASDIIALIL